MKSSSPGCTLLLSSPHSQLAQAQPQSRWPLMNSAFSHSDAYKSSYLKAYYASASRPPTLWEIGKGTLSSRPFVDICQKNCHNNHEVNGTLWRCKIQSCYECYCLLAGQHWLFPSRPLDQGENLTPPSLSLTPSVSMFVIRILVVSASSRSNLTPFLVPKVLSAISYAMRVCAAPLPSSPLLSSLSSAYLFAATKSIKVLWL